MGVSFCKNEAASSRIGTHNQKVSSKVLSVVSPFTWPTHPQRGNMHMYLGGVFVVSSTRIVPHELLLEIGVLTKADILNLRDKPRDSINSDSCILWKVPNEKYTEKMATHDVEMITHQTTKMCNKLLRVCHAK